MHTLNLGIVAHVDAGKTSLTERVLYEAGVLDAPGSVDDGTTQTDTLALERQRGITIRSAVVSFVVDGVTVNLIDTPGHSDFIAEVERALSVLDGAVLVVSAVEGVQAQTLVLMRTLQRLRLPVLLFVNKVDRAGARPEQVLREIAARLTPAALGLERVTDPGTAGTAVTSLPADDAAFAERLTELVAEHDEAVLGAWADGAAPGVPQLRGHLRALARRGQVHPVLFGSARTGAGVPELMTALTDLLPATCKDPEAPLRAEVFKIDRGPAREKLVYVHVRAGRIRTRQRLDLGHGRTGKVTGIQVFDGGSQVPADAVPAGRIGLVRGLDAARIGDTVGVPGPAERVQFARPSLETVVEPARPCDRTSLYAALTELAEQDPLIGLRQDDLRHELYVSLYGEVQKEVVQSVLADQYGVQVTFRETTPICVERVTGVGEAVEVIGTAPNPFLATVGLRVEPAPPGAGVRFGLEVELGSMPPAFFTAVQETVGETLLQGLHGWEVPDCTVTMTRSGYWARQSHAHGTFDKSMSSTAGDFRHLTRLVLMTALASAGTQVCEPVHRFELEVPTDTLGAVLTALAKCQAVPLATETRAASTQVTGELPARTVHAVQQQVPGLTRGEGAFTSALDGYRPVLGTVPERPRTDGDPLDRDEYVRRVRRRTTTP